MKIFTFIFSLVFLLNTSYSADSPNIGSGDNTERSVGAKLVCSDANFWGSNLINNVCWSCIFPIRMMGSKGLSFGSENKAPKGSTSKAVCACKDGLGVPTPGITASMFEPARVVEVVKAPYCSPIYGKSLDMGGDKSYDKMGNQGLNSQNHRLEGSKKLGFYNVHYYSFPLLYMLNIAGIPNCNPDGRLGFDIMGFSEFNPTWNDEEMGFFANPESVIFGNPMARLACVGDCVMSNFDRPNDKLFWCAGCWGNLTPHSGYFSPSTSISNNTSLLSLRALSLQFRTGMEMKTFGDDSVSGKCSAKFWPFVPKTQYKMSLVHPVPEASNTISTLSASDPKPTQTDEGEKYSLGDMVGKGKNCCHPLGKAPLLTGNEFRNIPGKDDYVYMLFRYKDCCVR